MGSASGRSFLRNCEALGNASQGEVCGGLTLIVPDPRKPLPDSGDPSQNLGGETHILQR